MAELSAEYGYTYVGCIAPNVVAFETWRLDGLLSGCYKVVKKIVISRQMEVMRREFLHKLSTWVNLLSAAASTILLIIFTLFNFNYIDKMFKWGIII